MMLDDFLVRTLLAGIGLAVAAAPLGCFVVWRRMAYFGDATSHAAVLGVALSLALSLPVFVGSMMVAFIMALTVSKLTGRGHAMDTLLGVLSHSALAIALVAVSFIHGVRLDLMAYLFGDILAVGRADLAVIWGGAALVVSVMIWRWNPLLMATLNPDLAQASGISAKREQLVLTIALAIVVAVAIKIVGALLIVAMLIIPPATARRFTTTPETMAIATGAVACAAVVLGIMASFQYDTPTGPSIACAAAALFALATLAAQLRGSA